MRRTGVDGVVCDAIGIQRTAAELHEVALCNLAQIWLAVASVQRSAFAKVQILKTDVGKATVNLDVAVEDAVFAVSVDRELARAGDAADYNARGFVSFPAPRQIDRHVIGQESVVQRLNSLAQRTEVRFCRRLNGWFYPQPGRTGIGLCYGVRDNLIRIKLLETDVAVGAHFHEYVFVVAGIEQLKQKVLRCNRHVVGANGDAAGLDLLRTCRHPCASRISFEKIRADRGVQPEHVGIQRCGRSRTTVDLLGIVSGSGNLECNAAGILSDTAFSVAHTAGKTINILGSSTPVCPCFRCFDLEIAELDCTGATLLRGSADIRISNADRIIAGEVIYAVGHMHPVAVGGSKVCIACAQIKAASGGGNSRAICPVEVVVNPEAGIHACSRGSGGVNVGTLDVKGKEHPAQSVAV